MRVVDNILQGLIHMFNNLSLNWLFSEILIEGTTIAFLVFVQWKSGSDQGYDPSQINRKPAAQVLLSSE